MELKFFQFYFLQLLVNRNTYVVENDGMEKKKEKKVCEHYFKPNLFNFIIKVCLISIAARCPWNIQTFDHDFARVRVQCHCHCLIRFFGICFLW